MFTFIILFTFIEACLDQSASEGQRKIAIFQYKLVLILKPQILSELTMPEKCRGSKSPDMRVSCFCLLLLMWLLQFTVTVSVGISIQSLLLLKTSCAGGQGFLKGQYIWQDFFVLCFAPCFYFPPKDQTFSGVSPLTASLSSQNILLWHGRNLFTSFWDITADISGNVWSELFCSEIATSHLTRTLWC